MNERNHRRVIDWLRGVQAVFRNHDEDLALKNGDCFLCLVCLMLQPSVSLEQVERY